jgi:2-methylisocitrate lyase-like PEP mutase family enzyme
MGLTTLTELTTLVAHIAAAVNIPMICDIDTGFGGNLNVQRTIREMIRAGAAGVHIEDQAMPKRSPMLEGRRILPSDEAIGRVKAALDARTDEEFVIVARSDADAISFEELIVRSNQYLEAGADVAFPMLINYEGTRLGQLSAAKQLEIQATLVKEIDGPVMGMGFPRPGMPTIPELVDIGVAIVIMPTTSLSASASAMLRVLRDLYTKGSVAEYFEANPEEAELLDGGLYNLVGMKKYLAVEEQFGL